RADLVGTCPETITDPFHTRNPRATVVGTLPRLNATNEFSRRPCRQNDPPRNCIVVRRDTLACADGRGECDPPQRSRQPLVRIRTPRYGDRAVRRGRPYLALARARL